MLALTCVTVSVADAANPAVTAAPAGAATPTPAGTLPAVLAPVTALAPIPGSTDVLAEAATRGVTATGGAHEAADAAAGERAAKAAGSAAAAGATNPKSVPMRAAAGNGATGSVAGPPGGPDAGPAAGVAFPQAPPGLLPRTGNGGLPGTPAVETGQPIGAALPDQGVGVTNVQVYALIQTYFPATEWERANQVSRCESGQRNVISPPNRNGSTDRGVFQLNDGGTLQQLLVEDGYPATRLELALDADWNVRAAARLWSQRGWQPWTCAAKLGYV